MRTTITIQVLFVLIFSSSRILGQMPTPNNDTESHVHHVHNHSGPCISHQEYQVLERECAENISLLGLDNNNNRSPLATPLNWPIRAAANFNDCDFYFIGAYVDHNNAVGSFQDYDCGTNTYDGHKGTDIAAWPYGFYKMDNSQVEVIAAAAGTIIQKADGNFDRNCSSNNLTANSIIIQHADGSQALYWHMKSNSLTAKIVGQTVVAGEYLGVVGSSGSSSGPHVHFEVWTGSTSATYNDPFSGTCNTLNAASWWTVQKPHTNSAVIKVSVNTTDIVLPGCPTTETPNESSNFVIPFQGAGLAPGYAKFYIFLRDDVVGLTADCKILNPNGTTFNSWLYTSIANNKTYIRGYSKLLPTIPGTYTFQVTYAGITCSKTFTIQTPLAVSNINTPTAIKIYPNPSSGKIFLAMENVISQGNKIEFIVFNSTGQLIKNIDISVDAKEIELDLSSGIYFYKLKNDSEIIKSGKFLIE